MSDEQNKATPSGTPNPSEPVTPAAAGDHSYTVEDQYDYNSHGYHSDTAVVDQPGQAGVPAVISSPPPPPSPPSASGDDDDEDEDDEGMLRMSFLEHLEELRSRIIRALIGLAVAFFACFGVRDWLWGLVQDPFAGAMASIGIKNARLVFTSPTESFTILWMKLPLVFSLFVASPWILMQVWGFIAPGLYKKERRLAGPFVLSTAGLFILGGLFAYFIAFRYGLAFLLGIGSDVGVQPMITITEYFDIFINVMLGVGIVFELPVLIFFLTLLRIASPRFLLSHSRYAILGIVIIAAVITPTPDVFNLMLVAVPMVALFFLGVFASYLLVLSREGKKFPWGKFIAIVVGVIALVAGLLYAIQRMGYHWIKDWPFLTK